MPTPPQRPLKSTAPYAPNPSASDAPSLPAQGPTLPQVRPSPAPARCQVPGYEIQGELGRGGMGVVYLAKNVLMNRLEVLKVANRARLDGQPGAAERFLREIRSAANLSHENVVKAYSALQVGELLVFAMEYVEGEDLDKLVQRQGPLPVAHACHYVSQAALGLQHAHEQGMIHRDIKPANLILTRRGKKHIVKVLDFGLAKAVREGETATDLTGAGAVMGTPAYMAPEQAQDAATADIRADIYSLGCTLYFLLTGAPPFDGKNIYAILKAHESTEATPLTQLRAEAPAELAAVVAKMMAKDPPRRYQKPIDVAKALAPFVKAAPPAPAAKSDRPAALPVPPSVWDRPTVPPARPAEVVWTEVDGVMRAAPLLGRPVAQRAGDTTAAAPAPSRTRRSPSKEERGRKTWPIAAAAGVLLLLVAGTAWWISGMLAVRPSDGRGDKPPPVDPAAYRNPDPQPPAPARLSGTRPPLLDCTKDNGVSAADVRKAQEAWASYLGRQVEEEDEIAPGVKMKFVLVPPGKFWMGSPEGEVGHDKDEVQHEVEITKPFYLGVYDVTQAQYEAVTGKTPSNFKGADLPVESVSWEDADAFAKGLTEKARSGLVYRLPTEAEWEYSCRGGRSSSLAFGVGNGTTLSTSDANFSDSESHKTTPVDRYKPNALGLYDMQGNVWQWCSDYYSDYPPGLAVNPKRPVEASRVRRGGCWCIFASGCRAANRDWSVPGVRYGYLGFRLARVPSGLDK